MPCDEEPDFPTCDKAEHDIASHADHAVGGLFDETAVLD
jgi:hypothetical protein